MEKAAQRKTLIGVIGASDADRAAAREAHALGREAALRGYALVCGGLGGVMEAACRGAREASAGALVVGVLPGYRKEEANPYVDLVITTGMGHARNCIVASSADAVVAVGGGSGTLSEIAFAWMLGKPIVVIEGLGGVSSGMAGGTLDRRRGDRIQGAPDAARALDLVEKLLAGQ